jgi:formylglycine-generating enzyme required for sulfatase activity
MTRWPLTCVALVLTAASALLGAAPPAPSSQPAPSTQPAKELTLDLDNKVTLKLVQIPAGKFMMGSPGNEKDRRDNEGPQHEVAISKAFYMGVTEVTQEQYEAVMGKNPSDFKGAKNPVEQVSWNDAMEFCGKLSARINKTVRLPTEAEWEYACRAGTTGAYGGTGKLEDMGWFVGNSDEQAHPVAQKQPNALGLFDMYGNVWEWCSDWYGKYNVAPVTDPVGPGNGEARVVRGGSWLNSPPYCRSAGRDGTTTGRRAYNLGFRVALDSR